MRKTVARLFAAQLAVQLAVQLPLQLALAPTTFAASVQPAQATPVQREQAQSKFLKGRELFAQKKYQAAYEQFRASMEIVSSPNPRLYAARSLREMGKLVEAYVEFGRTEIEAKELASQDPRYVKTGDSAAAERKEIEPKLGFVSVRVDHATDATTLEIGGEEVRRAAWSEPTPVVPGATTVVVKTGSAPPVQKTVSVSAGQKAEVTIDASPAAEEATPVVKEEPKPPAETTSAGVDLRTWAFVAGGVGAAGLVTFGVFGAMSRAKFNDLRDSCGGACPPSRQDDIDSGKRSQTIANIGLVVGIVGIGTGVTLFVLSNKRHRAATEVVATPSWIGLRGVF